MLVEVMSSSRRMAMGLVKFVKVIGQVLMYQILRNDTVAKTDRVI